LPFAAFIYSTENKIIAIIVLSIIQIGLNPRCWSIRQNTARKGAEIGGGTPTREKILVIIFSL
jgi:hypothetical protein